MISSEGVSTDPEKMRVVEEWPTPQCTKDVRSFIGLASYYSIAQLLHRLMEKNRVFQWTEDCEAAFQTLKKLLTRAPILAYPKEEEEFILDTDASSTGIETVLSPKHDGVEKVIAYASRTMSKPERNYCVTRRELLAVVTFIKHFRHYLYGRHFTIRTDHGALRWLLKSRNPEGQIARWMEVLSAYDFTIQQQAGRIHQNADALSRMPCKQCGRG